MAGKDKDRKPTLKKGDKPLKSEDLDKVVGGMPKGPGGHGETTDTNTGGNEVDDS